MHINTPDLLQNHFLIVHACNAGVRILLFNDETLIEPSTAAFTRLGARKASEMVMLTWRTLHFSRAQSINAVRP